MYFQKSDPWRRPSAESTVEPCDKGQLELSGHKLGAGAAQRPLQRKNGPVEGSRRHHRKLICILTLYQAYPTPLLLLLLGTLIKKEWP